MSAARRHTRFSDDEPRLLSQEVCQQVVDQIVALAEDGGETQVRITGWWNSELRWARNHVSVAADRRNVEVSVGRRLEDRQTGTVYTNQIDEMSLRAAVRAAERMSRMYQNTMPHDYRVQGPSLTAPVTSIWSDATYAASAGSGASRIDTFIREAEDRDLVSAGYLEVRACEQAQAGSPGLKVAYEHLTQAQCSATIRSPATLGSGWAGRSSFDWSRVDTETVARRALEKCEASVNPVRIEPGRYTVVLEPSAVCALLEPLMNDGFNRISAEQGGGAWALELDQSLGLVRTKLGLKVADERITIHHDPVDPDLGVVAERALEPITWIRQGILTELEHGRGGGARQDYTLPILNDNIPVLGRPAFRMEGGESSIAEMIASTPRGLLVTRFSHVELLDRSSYLLTGVTRDGLWLIENGKITKAVYNMRITESPLVVLNQIEALGPSEPAFRPQIYPDRFQLTPAVVPSLKARDFSFTSLLDAV